MSAQSQSSEECYFAVPTIQTIDRLTEVPWIWFGIAEQDSSWEQLFDEIEEARDATRQLESVSHSHHE
jgi:hypothetical protein